MALVPPVLLPLAAKMKWWNPWKFEMMATILNPMEKSGPHNSNPLRVPG